MTHLALRRFLGILLFRREIEIECRVVGTRRLKDDGTEETPEERAAVSGDLLPRNVVAGSYCPHSARQHARLNKRVIRTIYRIRRRMSMSMAFPS
jgi:hypothetical protein